MKPINCDRCGKMFLSLASRTCPECREEDEACLRRAKEILYRRPDLDIMGLANEADIQIELIEDFIRQGRLVFRKAVKIDINCEMCGKPISKGKRCDSCNQRIVSMVRQSMKQKQAERIGMHSVRISKARKDDAQQGGAK